MGIFTEMTACVTEEAIIYLYIIYNGVKAVTSPVFCTETLLDTEYISERWKTRLQVQLRALCEESGLSIVVEAEKGSTSFHLCLDKARRCDFEQMVSCV